MVDAKTARANAIENNIALSDVLAKFEKQINIAVSNGCFCAHMHLPNKTSIDVLNDAVSVMHKLGYDVVHDYATIASKTSCKPECVHHFMLSW